MFTITGTLDWIGKAWSTPAGPPVASLLPKLEFTLASPPWNRPGGEVQGTASQAQREYTALHCYNFLASFAFQNANLKGTSRETLKEPYMELCFGNLAGENLRFFGVLW